MMPGDWQESARKRRILPIVAAVALSILGLALSALSLFGDMSPVGRAKVTLDVRLQGQGGRPIEGSEIWVVRPETHFLGTTNRQGTGTFLTDLPKGKLAIIEARGATFRATREILIPNLSEYVVTVALNPDEARLGAARIESITNTNRDSRALEAYSDAVLAKNQERARLAAGVIRVVTAPSAEQPALSANERSFLEKLVPAFERGAKKIRYSLLSKQTHLIVLRLLRGGQSIALEIRLQDSNSRFLGARLVDAPSLKPNMIIPLLNDALASTGRVSSSENSGTMNRHESQTTASEQKSKQKNKAGSVLLKIRKRPVDDLLVFANGYLTQIEVNRDYVHAQFPNPAKAGNVLTLAATGRSGLMVVKPLEGRKVPRQLEWSWPEWQLSQRSAHSTP